MTDTPPANRARFRDVALFANVSLDRTEAALSVVSEFEAAEPTPAIVGVQILQSGFPVVTVEDPITLFPNGTSLVQSATLPRVQLWQPNGSGQPALYQARLVLVDSAGGVLDRRTLDFGVRQIDAEAREGGLPLLTINGRRTWLQGWSWEAGTADPERLLRLIQAAHVNLIHVWHGVESDEFYSLCDRLGLMVWQELPNPGIQVRSEGYLEKVLDRAEAAIAACRPHASLIGWVGGSHSPAALEELRAAVTIEDPQRLWAEQLRQPEPLDLGEWAPGTDFQLGIEAARRKQWECPGHLPGEVSALAIHPEVGPILAYYSAKRAYGPSISAA
jgi:beta-galactosidase/beta-glucuronidase